MAWLSFVTDFMLPSRLLNQSPRPETLVVGQGPMLQSVSLLAGYSNA
jgi:hypothetical protein